MAGEWPARRAESSQEDQGVPSLLAIKIEALVGTAPRDRIKWLYEALSILDAKANGLLRINSLVMTIISLFLAYAHSGDRIAHISTGFLIGSTVALLLLAGSSIICFFIVRMSWEFLRAVPAVSGTTAFTGEIDALAIETNRRTHLFVSAWSLGLAGFVLTMVLALFGAIVVLGSSL
jgi:hypothetical protein